MVRKYYDLFSTSSGGGSMLGQYAASNGLSGNSADTPFELDGPTITPKSNSLFNGWGGLVNGLLENGDDWIRALNGSQSGPQTVNNYTTAPGAGGGGDKTLLFVVLGVAVLVVVIVVAKK